MLSYLPIARNFLPHAWVDGFERIPALTLVSVLTSPVLTLMVSGCGPRAPELPQPEVLSLGDVSAHYWFEDNRLLLTGENSLTIYDLDSKASVSEVTLNMPGSRFNRALCLNEQQGILGFYARPGGGQKFYQVNWSSPEQFTELDTFSGPGEDLYNPQDCSLLENEQPPSLLNSEDAYLTIESDSSEANGPQLNLTIGPPNSPLDSDQIRNETIDVATRSSAFRWRKRMNYDSAADSYLFTFEPPSFSSRPKNWTYEGWIFSPEAQLQRTIAFPAGPWVYEHGFLKVMSCFSCGCACYESLDLEMQGEQIFSMVYGKAINDEHRGLYKLEETGDRPTWQPIARGEGVDTHVAISPDGCRAALQTDMGMTIYETCEQAGS